MAWIPVPEPQVWQIAAPANSGGMRYATVTLVAPTAEDIMKATAVSGASGMDVTLRMIESVSLEHVPYDVLKRLPGWQIIQMSDYMDAFGGAPDPDPLEAWRKAKREAAAADPPVVPELPPAT
jgi:hypothetical protein